MKRTFGLVLLLLVGLTEPALAQRHAVFPQFASGSGWSSEFFFANQGLSPTSGTVSFYDESGAPLTVASNIGTGSVLAFALSAGATQAINVTASGSQVAGYVVATYPSGAPVRATEVFRNR